MSPQEMMSIAWIKICHNYPYLQQIVYGLIRKETPGYGTLGVTKKGILYWDPDFVAKLSLKELCGVLIHELLHLIYQHAERAEMLFANHKLWNFAGDVAINATIRSMGDTISLPKNCLTEKSFDPPLPEGKTTEEYYRIIQDRQEDSCLSCGAPLGQSGQQNQGQAQSQGSGQSKQNQGKGAGQPGQASGQSQSGSTQGSGGKKQQGQGQGQGGGHECENHPAVTGGWCGSAAGNRHPNEKDSDDTAGRSEADLDLYRKMVAEAIRDEASKKGRGTIPEGFLRWADSILSPAKIPWQQKLRRAVRFSIAAFRKGSADYSYHVMSRLQHSMGFKNGTPILPGMTDNDPNVGVALDTSGSMSEAELTIGLREIMGVLKSTKTTITFYASDCAVHQVTKVRTHNDLLKSLKGGGGTDLDPVFEYINTQPKKVRPDILIYATDGICPVNRVTVPGMKVIWLLVGKGHQNPGFRKEDIVIELDD